MITKLNVRVPILHIEKNKYLIGNNKCNCSLKGDAVLIRVGGGYERFENYMTSNHDSFQLILVSHMESNKWTLEEVIQKIMKGETIRTNISTKWNMKLTL